MKNIFVICLLNLKIIMRKKTMTAFALLLALLVGAIYFIVDTGSVDINDYTTRWKYAMNIGYSLIVITILIFAAFLMNNQLENKHIHLLASFPASRMQIFFGKVCSVFSIAILLLTVLYSVLFISKNVYLANNEQEKSQKINNYFNISKTQITPFRKSVDQLAKEKLASQGIESYSENDFENIKESIIREMQTPPVRPSKDTITTKELIFNDVLATSANDTVKFIFRIKSYSTIDAFYGEVIVQDEHFKEYQVHKFKDKYAKHDIVINLDASKMPVGKSKIIIKIAGSETLKFVDDKTVLIIDNSSGLINNIKAFFLQGIHLLVVSFLGISVASILTFPGALFSLISLYVINLFMMLFDRLKDGLEDSQIFQLFFTTGNYIAKLINGFDIITLLSKARTIVFSLMIADILFYLIFIGILCFIINIFFNNRELDQKVFS